MDLIKHLAEDIVIDKIDGQYPEYEIIIDLVKTKLYDINNVSDKIKFLNIILEGNSKAYDLHKPGCIQPQTCPNNISHESISYYLGQELEKVGVIINEDAFTAEDKIASNEKLEKILQELQSLKDGQQIIYEQMVKEVDDLKELYYLGKKRWYRQLAGTAVEMTASGIISETVSKNIIDIVKQGVNKLIS